MSSAQLNPEHFSSDTLLFIHLLCDRQVKFMIVGGEAVIHYGFPRVTGDVDFFYAASPENCARIHDALLEFWDGDIPGIGSVSELEPEGVVIQFGRPPNRIDLINQLSGVSFDEAWADHKLVAVGELDVPYIGIAALIKNKSATGRTRDLADVEKLEELRGSDGHSGQA